MEKRAISNLAKNKSLTVYQFLSEEVSCYIRKNTWHWCIPDEQLLMNYPIHNLSILDASVPDLQKLCVKSQRGRMPEWLPLYKHTHPLNCKLKFVIFSICQQKEERNPSKFTCPSSTLGSGCSELTQPNHWFTLSPLQVENSLLTLHNSNFERFIVLSPSVIYSFDMEWINHEKNSKGNRDNEWGTPHESNSWSNTFVVTCSGPCLKLY